MRNAQVSLLFNCEVHERVLFSDEYCVIQGVRCGLLEAVCQECPEKEFSIRSIPLVNSPGNSERTMNREFNSREKRASQFAYEVRTFPRDGVAGASGVRHSINWLPQLGCWRSQNQHRPTTKNCD